MQSFNMEILEKDLMSFPTGYGPTAITRSETMWRMPESRKFWEEELVFIRRIDPKEPNHSFNCDADCFRSYVRMQARFAREDGFSDLSDGMLEWIGGKRCRDIGFIPTRSSECLPGLRLKTKSTP